MTTTAEMIAVMQAFERGEKVEFKCRYSEGWVDTKTPSWDWAECDYRVAPKPIDLVEVLKTCFSRMVNFDIRPADKQDVLGHAWADIIQRAKDLQG